MKVKEYGIETVETGKTIDVKVASPKICPRFSARIIDGIKIEPSPDFIKKRLEGYGFRSINNVVDITNYVMLATGQPLHAFDYDKIKDGRMNIRLSRSGEEVVTLDGVIRKLQEGTIIIEDEEKIYDLAAIMGGYKSEVDNQTKTIILVGSIFDPVLVRRASKYLNHTTDSSYRYERGVDYDGNIYGIDMAASLVRELVPSAKIGELVDKKLEPLEKPVINFSTAKINKLLGVNLSLEEINNNLKRLNFTAQNSSAVPPSYRVFDVKIWQDLAEEVARIYGYNNLDKINLEPTNSTPNPEFSGTEIVKDKLVDLGFTEIYSYSFSDKAKMELLNFDPSTQPKIEKPLSSETEYLRPSVLISLLDVISKNPWSPEVNVFEMEAVFGKETEKWQLGLATTGKSDVLLKSAAASLGVEDSKIQAVDQAVLDDYKIRRPVRFLIEDIDRVKLAKGKYCQEITSKSFQEISKYPPTVRDLAFVVDKDLSSEEVGKEIQDVDDRILLVELFDEFVSDKLGSNKKNLAFHVWFQDLATSLSDTSVEEMTQEIVGVLKEKFNASLRA